MEKQRNAIYKTKQWDEVRKKVFKLDHYECVRCNHTVFHTDTPKKLTRPTLVHHIFEAEKYPQYKYDIYVEIGGKTYRNLVSLCFDCHEEIHGRKKAKEGFINEERYD